MTDEAPLLREATLDRDAVAALVTDLAACATAPSVQARTRDGTLRASLDEVPALLARDDVRFVQVRYRFEDLLWIDTLTPHPDAVHLLRVGHRAPTGG